MEHEVVSDPKRGELRIWGRRVMAVNAQELCNHLDTLVGLQVSEVIMHNLELRAGKLDAAKVRAEHPERTLRELVDHFVRDDGLSGLGITKVTLSENANRPIEIEIANPSVKGTGGAAKAFAFSWWAGVFTALLDREMDVANFVYYADRDVMRCQMVPRS
jgi:hypothetical protein